MLMAVEDDRKSACHRPCWRRPRRTRSGLSIGYPFFTSRAGCHRVEVLGNDHTDREEFRELVTGLPDTCAEEAHPLLDGRREAAGLTERT